MRDDQNGRVVSIDGLRGLFAAIVLVYHYTSWTGVELPPGVSDILARLAIYAVCGFFVISGTGLALAYRKAPPSNVITLGAFWVKRFLRIAPLFYLVLLLTNGRRLLECLSGSECQVPIGLWLSNFSMLFGLGRAAENSLVVAGWSLGIEWVFYILFPGLILIALRIRFGAAMILSLGIGLLVAWDLSFLSSAEQSWLSYAQVPAYLAYFAAGVVMGLRMADHRVRSSHAWAALAIALGAYAGLEAVVVAPFNDSIDVAGPTAWAFAVITSAVVAAVGHFVVTARRAYALLDFAGKISFGIYLLHYPVFTWLSAFGLSGWWAVVAGALVTPIVATAVFYILEAPFMRLGRRWSDAWRQWPRPATARAPGD